MMSKMNNNGNNSLPTVCAMCLVEYCWLNDMTTSNSTNGWNGTTSSNTTLQMGLHVTKMKPRWQQWSKHD